MTSSIGYSKGRVLYLYRRILKLGKAWEGTQEVGKLLGGEC